LSLAEEGAMTQGGVSDVSDPKSHAKKKARARLAQAEAKIAELEQALEAARSETAAASDRALRTLAEFDNYRKRSERERREAVAAGAAEVVAELLTFADDFDRALAAAGDETPAPFLDGLRNVARKLSDLLQRHGVARIESVGTPFDPVVHEALTAMPSGDVPPGTVLQELQAGYRMGEKVLRPARVVVARAPEE
jgi:molecular chaperone GrpE